MFSTKSRNTTLVSVRALLSACGVKAPGAVDSVVVLVVVVVLTLVGARCGPLL